MSPLVRDLSATLLSAIQRDAGYKVARATAMQVPAFVKALKTYTHTISAFPLREYANGDAVIPRAFLSQPIAETTYAGAMTRLIGELLMYDRAYWKITHRAWDGFPDQVELMPNEQLTILPDDDDFNYAFDGDGPLYWNGVRVPFRDVVRFDGDGLGGWLTTGASAINTAAALEAAAQRYAEYPLPSIILKNTGADLGATQVDAMLTAWETGRLNRSTAYLNSALEIKELGWNASDMQLVDSRNAAAIQIARVANLDPIWTGAGVPGSSLTYSNRTDLYRQLLDTALTPIMNMVSQRISANDVTPRGHRVTFDTSIFLKANVQDIAILITQLLPLGVITTDEARTLLDLPALGVAQ
jgi:hypothetical protein